VRFDTQQPQYYCGGDLHARAKYVRVLDTAGDKPVHRNIPAQPAPLLKLLDRRRPVGVGAECVFRSIPIACFGSSRLLISEPITRI